MTTTGTPTPGWYPDPGNPQQLRWYDGTQWTDAVHPAGPPTSPPQASYQAPVAYQTAGTYQAPTYAQPQYAQQPASGCQVCGAGPTLQVHLRGHQGMILLMRFLTFRGQYCRDCGVAKFREVQSRTMLVGWWGYLSLLFNTYNVFHNLNQLRRLKGLGAAQGRVRAALAMPSSVFRSPGFAVTVGLPVLVILYALSQSGS